MHFSIMSNRGSHSLVQIFFFFLDLILKVMASCFLFGGISDSTCERPLCNKKKKIKFLP